MTHLAVSIFVENVAQAHAAAALAAEHGADLVEYRIDNFTEDHDENITLVQESPLPCIVTCRPTWEGGDYDGDEMERISLVEHIGMGTRSDGTVSKRRPAYLDIELKAFDSSANLKQKVELVVDHPQQHRPVDTGLILSTHDFKQRPADLFQKLEKMLMADSCRVVKAAWMARSLRDNIEAFELQSSKHKPTIALCMGEFGLPSRVLAKKFGALLTFVGQNDEEVTAPGQVGIRTIKELYRWDQLNASTKVYGVIGWPVAHSMSPAIHNAGFDQVDHNGVYLPLPIPPEYEHFKATVSTWLDFKPLHFSGASVTIPHKENLIRYVEEMDGEVEPLAKTIGAANTLTVREDGSLYASNTDYAAAIDALCDAMGIEREALKGVKVGVIGAGGAARAIVAALAHYGAETTIYNRTLERAENLAKEFSNSTSQIKSAELEALKSAEAKILINCTPIGMHPNIDDIPLPDSSILTSDMVVFDTIYNPIQTQLLKDAQGAGAQTISGVEMFTRQAMGQFELWTEQSAPRETFEKVVLNKLNADK